MKNSDARTIKVNYISDISMPKLGWIAVFDSVKRQLQILHGEFVERSTDWIVEGVWDGDFKAGEFHKTDTFFGSGIRIEQNRVYFVPSTAKTDRILYCQDDNQICVSNSLLLLLSFTGATLDGDHDYVDESISVAEEGLTNYKRAFRIRHTKIQTFYQIYHENIVIENGETNLEPKKRNNYVFACYTDYYQALMNKLSKMRENYESSDRKWILKAYTTISSGYDAAAVSCLAKKLEVAECFTGKPLDGLVFGRQAEPSERIARKLGCHVKTIESRRSKISEDELFFLAGNYPRFTQSVWSEISLHGMVKNIQNSGDPAVVFMGYFGDDVWGTKAKIDPETGDLLSTPPISGSNLAEIRLLVGFVCLSPAYMFIKDVAQIRQVSDASEMDNWRLNNNYDRPIPRRIAEETGVPRNWFGMEKRHITTTYLWPINKQNRLAFYQYLKKEEHIGWWTTLMYYLRKRILKNMFSKNIAIKKEIDFYDIMRKWATSELTKRYSVILAKSFEAMGRSETYLPTDTPSNR